MVCDVTVAARDEQGTVGLDDNDNGEGRGWQR